MTDSPTPPPAPDAPRVDAANMPAAIPPDIARLFRHSLAEGCLHPLMPLLVRHRQARDDGDAAPCP